MEWNFSFIFRENFSVNANKRIIFMKNISKLSHFSTNQQQHHQLISSTLIRESSRSLKFLMIIFFLLFRLTGTKFNFVCSLATKKIHWIYEALHYDWRNSCFERISHTFISLDDSSHFTAYSHSLIASIFIHSKLSCCFSPLSILEMIK